MLTIMKKVVRAFLGVACILGSWIIWKAGIDTVVDHRGESGWDIAGLALLVFLAGTYLVVLAFWPGQKRSIEPRLNNG